MKAFVLNSLANRIKSLLVRKPVLPCVVDFDIVSTEQIQRSYQAGLEVQSVISSLAEEERTVLDVVLNHKPHQAWEHYPWQGGILDQRTSSQYFYHSHADYHDEHGHFHTYYYQRRKLVHLVAIALDKKGNLIKLYTFNRWGPGDTYFPANKLKAFLPKFRIGNNQGFDARIHAYLQNVLILFRAEIEYLFEQRDETFQRYREEHNGQSPFEDRSLEITSTLEVDLDIQMERLRAKLENPESFSPHTIEVHESDSTESLASSLPEIAIPSLEQRSLKQIQQSVVAGKEICEVLEKFKTEGKNVLEVVMNHEPYEVWKMYPWDEGVIDKNNKSQYFYHSHPQTPEHGHFHTFYHYRNELVHLVAIALDNSGEPIELMTVNRWVTGDLYVPAKKLKSFLPRFRVSVHALDRRLHQFIHNLLLLYQPEIQSLLDQRDQTFKLYRQEHNGKPPFEDRSLEVTSSLSIEVEAHIQQLEEELQRRSITEK